jgi:hypothetical protein
MSHAPRTLYVNKQNSLRIKPLTMVLNEVALLSIDWNAYLNSSLTVSSSTWTAENTAITAASSTNSAGVTGITCTAADEGESMLKNQVTLSNGEKLVRKFRVKVIDPEVDGNPTDYPS